MSLAALAPVVGSLVGGLMNSDSQRSANSANKQIAQAQLTAQQDAAKNGISWRVQDAVNAGLSPLVGAGASTTSISPTAIGMQANTGMGDAVSNMGQHVGRAAMAMQDPNTKKASAQLEALALERAQLNNELLRSQITKINSPTQAGSGPGLSVATLPSEQTAAMHGSPHMEASAGTPSWKMFDSSPGNKMILPSDKLKAAVEDSPYEMQLFVSDFIKKFTGKTSIPGYKFNPWTGEFEKYTPTAQEKFYKKRPELDISSNFKRLP